MSCNYPAECGKRTHLPKCLAKEFGVDERELERLRIRLHWPCLKPNRKTVRYADEHVELIRQSITTKTKSPAKKATSKGQTVRSASRIAS